MGWFGNKKKEDNSRSTGKERTSKNLSSTKDYDIKPYSKVSSTGGAVSVISSTQHSYVAPITSLTSAVAPISNIPTTNTETRYNNSQQPDYNQPYTNEDEEEPVVLSNMGTGNDRHNDDDELVMIDKNHNGRDAGEYVGEDGEQDPSRSYSQAEETEPEEPVSYADVSKQNHLNSLFNGHLMKWKFEAEEGSGFIRIPAFFGSLGLIGTAIAAVVMYPEAWEAHSLVMTGCVVIMSVFIAVLEGRFLSLDPLSARAHLRNIMTRNFNILRFLWGRGLLYITAGVLNVAQTWLITMISGGFMIALGILTFIIGVRASRKFAALRNSLADESFLLLVFTNYDGDGDGYLKPHEFALLLSSLGMELDDRYTLKAFTAIDTDKNRKISFEELHHWWTSGYIERGRRFAADQVGDEESYRRMD